MHDLGIYPLGIRCFFFVEVESRQLFNRPECATEPSPQSGSRGPFIELNHELIIAALQMLWRGRGKTTQNRECIRHRLPVFGFERLEILWCEPQLLFSLRPGLVKQAQQCFVAFTPQDVRIGCVFRKGQTRQQGRCLSTYCNRLVETNTRFFVQYLEERNLRIAVATPETIPERLQRIFFAAQIPQQLRSSQSILGDDTCEGGILRPPEQVDLKQTGDFDFLLQRRQGCCQVQINLG